jgi:hydrogenase expression/formation protein HypC
MRVQSVEGLIAHCAAKGVEREANLIMLQHEQVEVGDYLVIHLGYAMDKISEGDAAAAWDIYDQMLAAQPPAEPS